VKAFTFQDTCCHVISEYFQRIFLGIDSIQVSGQYFWSTLIIARIIIYGSSDWMQIQGPLSQAIEAPVSIPFVPTVRAAELRWWNGYLNTYHSFNDLIQLRGHYQSSFNRRPISTVCWQMDKSAQDIYATALTILQVGQPTIRLPPNPDFNSLSPEEKDRIYQDLHNQVDSLVLQRKSFAHRALSRGDTGPALELGLSIQEFVVAFVCRFQVILLHGYINFPTIDHLRQRLLD
jgi:hypothetical protein